jgi:predicted Zn-dependent protease
VYRVGVRLGNDVTYSGAIRSYLPFFGPSQIVITSLSAISLKLSWFYYHQFETGMKIERKSLPNGSYTVVSDQLSSVDTFIDTDIDINKQYRYKIYAYSPYNISYTDSLDVQYSVGMWVKIP